MPSGKREAARMWELGALAAAQPEEIRTRRTAAEDTYSAVRARLGMPGTYDLPGTAGAGSALGAQDSSFVTEKAKGAQATKIDPRYTSKDAIQDITKIDKDKYLKNLEGSSEFRIASRLTAEAEQSLAREGPLYDQMLKSTQLPIIEGSAMIARENAQQLKRAAQRGGAARRNAFEAVQQIREQERINGEKIRQLSQTRLQIDKWARDNARSQLKFNQNWAANLGGIRESFNSAMDQASELMLTKALPLMIETSEKAAALRHRAHAKNRAKVGRWISGVMGVASMALGGIGALGLGTAGSTIGAISSAAEPHAGALIGRGAEMLGAAGAREY